MLDIGHTAGVAKDILSVQRDIQTIGQLLKIGHLQQKRNPINENHHFVHHPIPGIGHV